MTYNLVLAVLTSLSLTLPLIMTPLPLGLWILFMSFTSTMLLTLLSSSWFGLVLFIIYIGGMLVMFSYFAAITPNQKLNILSLISLFISTLMLIMLLISSTQHLFSPYFPSMFYFNPSISFLYLLTPLQTPTLFLLASLLLLALIFVVKIANRTEGPLRPFTSQ